TPTLPGTCTGACPIHTVFLILMENHDWSSIKGSPSAPYINDILLPIASHAEQYYNPPGVHPSEPNYLWLEAGTNFGILNDNYPSSNHQSSTSHLVNLLEAAGLSWRATEVPKILASQAYAHNGVLFILWDEGGSGGGPIGMIALSPKAKGGGYANTIHYTHSSTLRTIEEIFGVTPMLGDAANATDLRDLFVSFP